VLGALVDWVGLDGLELAGVELEVQPARPTVPAISSAVAAVERFIVIHFSEKSSADAEQWVSRTVAARRRIGPMKTSWGQALSMRTSRSA
jgi:hypothetical protein